MMKYSYYLFIILFTFFSIAVSAQTGSINGIVKINGSPAPSVSIQLLNTDMGAITTKKGKYFLNEIPFGSYILRAHLVGYEPQEKPVLINDAYRNIVVDFDLLQKINLLSEVVITGTKTFKRRTESPVIVNVLNSKALSNLQACNLSEGLKFQPGLRVETDCQTCNYTQLRMNGLPGGYSQILINGRPIFSPLMSLYGMEQLPENMIEKIEVVRGSGSSLYGSSAIGGTVNVITKIPQKNTYELNNFYQNMNNQTNDYLLNGNASLVSKSKNAGVSFFVNHRKRNFYDANDDNFSELPKIKNTSLGANIFLRPRKNQKLEVGIINLNEYRFGGEMTNKPAYLTQQSEERTHKIWLGSIDYQINFNQDNSSLITYAAWQNTNRKHYTGIFPDDVLEIQKHLKEPPYGTSKTTTLQGGFQINHRLNDFLKGKNVITLGSEFLSDKVLDQISSYNYKIDQHTKNWGTFLQSDWEILPSLNLLSGVRMDIHNLVSKPIFSPRLALLYKIKNTTQLRLGYGTGFRAPQAFDTDLHIAFAGGGVSRVQLSPNLKEERSQSFSASINYDKSTEKFIAGFTLEGFYTPLKNAFVLTHTGNDPFGEIFEKQNGKGAIVKGITLELRGNYNKKIQLETGFTVQSSQFKEPVEYVQGVGATKKFLRTPNDYGFANLNITPNDKWNINLNYVYTGKMTLAHFGGADNFLNDKMVTSQSFSEVNSKIGYTFHLHKHHTDIELYSGVKNIFNAYQNDFDTGKNRDSNYIYGPAMPRTVFIGIKIKPE